MADILLTSIDPDLEREIELRARQNGRSVSEEAVALMREAIDRGAPHGKSFWDDLRSAVGEAYFTDDELKSIERSRAEPDRPPPDFA